MVEKHPLIALSLNDGMQSSALKDQLGECKLGLTCQFHSIASQYKPVAAIIPELVIDYYVVIVMSWVEYLTQQELHYIRTVYM